VVGTGLVEGVGACTLLGPEGPDVPAFRGGVMVFLQAFTEASLCAGGCGGFWPSVENYIVDASILETALLGCFTIGETLIRVSFRGCLVWRSLVNFASWALSGVRGVRFELM